MPKTAIVLGSAAGCWEEFDTARAMIPRQPIVIACNHAFRDAPFEVAHAVTMHPDLFKKWVPERRALGFPDAGSYWHARHRIPWEGVTSRPIESWGGSSGMLCVAVAFELGCDRIVLAGVPLLKTAQHFDDHRNWDEARQYRWAWQSRRGQLLGRVKSMSGWTRDLLGSPEEAWFADDPRTAAAAP
jgi:hypothetical protein